LGGGAGAPTSRGVDGGGGSGALSASEPTEEGGGGLLFSLAEGEIP